MTSHRLIPPLSAALLLATLGSAFAAQPTGVDSPHGFGNIPFGAQKDKALDLNAGNGQLTDNPDKTATLTYTTLVAGIAFNVAQNFDADGRATDVRLTYQTKEENNACIDRFNFVLAQLTSRYGRPKTPTVLRREDSAGQRTDDYSIEFAFTDKAAIKADIKTSFPLPQKGAAATPAAAPGGGAAAAPVSDCQISLQYLPPGWTANF